MLKTLLIFGGTFDPVHLGHIKIIENIQKQLNFDHIKIIPNYQSPLKAQTIASNNDRINMLNLAFEHIPNIEIDTLELNRQPPSYSFDTLSILRETYPLSSYSLCFLIGMDAFSHFNKWHQWEQFLAVCHLIIIDRPNQTLSNTMKQFLDKHLTNDFNILKKKPCGYCYRMSVGDILISSTDIKAHLKQQLSVEEMISKPVLTYIKNQGLYQNK